MQSSVQHSNNAPGNIKILQCRNTATAFQVLYIRLLIPGIIVSSPTWSRPPATRRSRWPGGHTPARGSSVSRSSRCTEVRSLIISTSFAPSCTCEVSCQTIRRRAKTHEVSHLARDVPRKRVSTQLSSRQTRQQCTTPPPLQKNYH